MQLTFDRFDSPIGPVQIFALGQKLCGIEFEEMADRLALLLRRRFGAYTTAPAKDPLGARSRLRAYFNGDIAAIDTLPVDTGGTPFQAKVWKALRRIRAGETTTYGALAVKLGCPTAMRAVGAANGANPVAIVVPCHRVIGADGSLTGYGGGIERKRWLLAHEGARSP